MDESRHSWHRRSKRIGLRGTVARALCAIGAVGLFAVLAGAPARAETVYIDGHLQLVKSDVPCPRRGMTMSRVEARFGAPTKRYAAVGQPPITRWDYPHFSVFFEYKYVIHSVVHAPAHTS